MGSKRSLAPKIARKISREHPRATVLDVFSGMCAVGTEVVSHHALFTNDIHAFAEVVAEALFIADDKAPSPREISKLLAAFEKNRRALSHLMDSRLKRERSALDAIADSGGGWKKLRDFTERELSRTAPIEWVGLDDVEHYRQHPRAFPYCLASSYFASAYFGLGQSIEIDSLRYAIDQGPKELRARYLCALVQAVSHCTTSPGHFAQFLIPRDKNNTTYIGRIRGRSVLTRFLAALVSFPGIECLDRKRNRVFRSDALSLLRDRSNVFPKKDFVIYADPPYSKAQYSRYYHVLETIVLYDYPSCEGKGRYRRDRFQTNFSRIAGVVERDERVC